MNRTKEGSSPMAHYMAKSAICYEGWESSTSLVFAMYDGDVNCPPVYN